jgi:RecJ-like exonuclease
MNDIISKLEKLNLDIEKTKEFFMQQITDKNSSIQIYTHIDADGLSSGAILGKALYRENIPFQITILKQLEKEEIDKIIKKINEYNNHFMIFSDFGSGQYDELQKKLFFKDNLTPFIILDHHLPQKISRKEDLKLLGEIHQSTRPWHINPYFYDIDGSNEVSGAGICYYFAKCLNERNIDLSPIAVVGAIGDLQNQGPNKSFQGLNSLILKDAINSGLIEVIDDLNFSSIKPLNEAIAYSSEIKLPGLTNDVNKTLKFLQTLGILMENSKGNIRTLNDMNKDEKQKISSAIIEYATLKLDIEPMEVIQKLIVNKYLLKNEIAYSDLYDSSEFSNLLNACGRTNNGSIGIAIAMGDRKNAYQQAQDTLVNYKKLLFKSLIWIKEEKKIQEKDYIQYFFGEDVISENIIGTISSMLIFDNSGIINKSKPIFGYAKRIDEDVYKISARAHEKIVNQGVNLSEAIRKALDLTDLDALGGGHPPAAGTKVPVDKIDEFLENCNKIIKKQLNY